MKFTTDGSDDSLSAIEAALSHGGEEQLVDLSGGCSHIREVAEETGVEWERSWSNVHKFTLNDLECESWYDEEGSCYSPWNIFAKGIGTFRGRDLREAIGRLLKQ